MAYTHSKIAEYIVGSGGISSYTFNNIPQNYTDLKLVASVRSSRTADYVDDIDINFNGDYGARYSNKHLADNQGTINTNTGTNATYLYRTSHPANITLANTFGNLEMYIANYAATGSKAISIDFVSPDNTTHGYLGFTAGLYAQSSSGGIASITLKSDQATFMQYSSFTLYGIRGSEY